jgi:hypothetical protein
LNNVAKILRPHPPWNITLQYCNKHGRIFLNKKIKKIKNGRGGHIIYKSIIIAFLENM